MIFYRTDKIYLSTIKFYYSFDLFFSENVLEKYGKVSKKVKDDEKRSHMDEKGQN